MQRGGLESENWISHFKMEENNFSLLEDRQKKGGILNSKFKAFFFQ